MGLPKQRQVKVDWYELLWFTAPLCNLCPSKCGFNPIVPRAYPFLIDVQENVKDPLLPIKHCRLLSAAIFVMLKIVSLLFAARTESQNSLALGKKTKLQQRRTNHNGQYWPGLYAFIYVFQFAFVKFKLDQIVSQI